MKISKYFILFPLAFLLMVGACKDDEENQTPGSPPTVKAGTDLSGTVGNTISLRGIANDPDGDQLTITWSIVSSPATSNASIGNSANLNTSFVPDAAGPYTITLTANDGNFAPVTDEIIVTAMAGVGEPPVAIIVDENGQLINEANDNNKVLLGTNYILDASDSNDPDGDALTFEWEVLVAPEDADYTLDEIDANRQRVFAPRTIGEYVFRVTVTDADGNAVSEEATLTAAAETIIVTQNVDADTVWRDLFSDPDMPDYIVKNDIEINALLNIEPGVVVHLDEDVIISVESGGGTLVAEGTEDSEIVFTSSDEAGQIYWGGLAFSSSSALNSLDHVHFAYGGGDDKIAYVNKGIGRYIGASLVIKKNGKVSIKNSIISHSEDFGFVVYEEGQITAFENNRFTNNSAYPILMPANMGGMIDEASTFADNGEKAVAIFESTLNGDASYSDKENGSWKALNGGHAYRIFGKGVMVEDSMVIAEGARLEFVEDAVLRIESTGYLKAIGSVENPIIFTNTTQNSSQLWGGIQIASDNVNNQIMNAEVNFAGGDEWMYLYGDIGRYVGANISVRESGKLQLEDTKISNSGDYGLAVEINGTVNGLTDADTDPETAILNANDFSGNTTENIVFE